MRKTNHSPTSKARVAKNSPSHSPDPWSDFLFLLGVIATLISISFKPSTAVMILAPSIAFLGAKIFFTHKTISKTAIEILISLFAGSLTLVVLYAAHNHALPA
jgi:energy-coupling factor transporter transmembrane protein EcfT